MKGSQRNLRNKRKKKAQLREEMICRILGNSAWVKERRDYTADMLARAAVGLANEILAELEMDHNRL